MDGVPWELDQLPRGQYVDVEGDRDLFGTPPPRKQRTRKTKDVPLGTISEGPKVDVAVSTEVEDERSVSPLSSSGKAQRGQINTLAKMLSALRR